MRRRILIIALAISIGLNLGAATYGIQFYVNRIAQPTLADVRTEGFIAGVKWCSADLVNEITLGVVRRHGAGVVNSVVQEGGE